MFQCYIYPLFSKYYEKCFKNVLVKCYVHNKYVFLASLIYIYIYIYIYILYVYYMYINR